jgi:hypothetical protein
MNKIIQFGETVEGFSIPVLNEREIRAAAGLLFLMLFLSVMFVAFKENFLPLKYAVTIFLVDILLRVVVSPRYAPSLILGRLIVRNQTPEYVGAQQKKFAWLIGIVLASIFFVHMVVVNAYSPITGVVCFVCLIFLFFEAAFGICLGCKFYPWVHKEKPQLCPGEVCSPAARTAIQKTSAAQLMAVVAFAAFVTLLAFAFNDTLSLKPADIFGINTPKPS